MNIVYCIGNGFDLAQGLHTSYKSFYDKYTKDYPLDLSPCAKKLRENISGDYESWADLEIGLGEYTTKLTEEEHDTAYFNISDSLRKYLKGEEKLFSPIGDRKSEVLSDISTPYKNLLDRDAAEIIDIIDKRFGETVHINIISFNYTNILEQILPEHNHIPISPIRSKPTYLENIYHVHGTTDTTMIMGVNDPSQLRNESFRENPDICDVIVKPQTQEAIRSNDVLICKKLIQNADIIVIFGMSLGETDKLWWNLIGNTILNKQVKLILFEHINKPIDFARGQKLGAKRKEVIKKFTSKLNIHPNFIPTVEKNIFVNFSTDFFAPHNNS